MNDEGYNREEGKTMEGQYQRHKRACFMAFVLVSFGLGQAVLGIAACGIELALLHQIFTTIFEFVPGEEQAWSSWLLACTGLSFLCAYDLLRRDKPDSAGVCFISRAVSLCLPLYSVGLALGLACVIFLNAEGVLFETASSSAANFFSTESSGPETSSFIEALLPHFTAIFAVAIGVFAILNLFAAQRLIELACGNLMTAYERITRFKEAHRAILTFRNCQKRGAELACNIAGLEEKLRNLRVIVANEIVSTVHTALLTRQKLIDDYRREQVPPPNRLVPKPPRPPVDAIAKRIAQLRSITAADVLKVLDASKL